ncbi:MAG: hypothetical protein CVU39_10850 [Chloroflexi bacterium HGW-Chloroflexi-10]|nr:MAG: hypothetical protein CVU39_10850 [Chloroflexi bacterium HGW-Chloroflexi-10]
MCKHTSLSNQKPGFQNAGYGWVWLRVSAKKRVGEASGIEPAVFILPASPVQMEERIGMKSRR